jgi:two-component system sensor histidine kinase KdpD
MISLPPALSQLLTAPAQSRRSPGGKLYLWLVVSIAITTAIAWALRGLVPEESLAMVFLSFVLISSVIYGRNVGIVTALIAFMTFNVLFLEPRFRFSFAPLSDTLTIGVFLGLALLTGSLAGRVRDQARETERRASTMTLLFHASRVLGSSADREVLAGILAREVAQAAHSSVYVFVRQGDGIVRAGYAHVHVPVTTAHPQADHLAQPEVEHFAERAWTETSARGASDSLPAGPFLAHPLGTIQRPVGLLVRDLPSAGTNSAIDEQTITILCELGAIAMERAYLMQEMTRTQISLETDRLRTALLSSISHDFRTPLSAILASVTAMIEQGDRFPPETARELLGDIRDQAERANRYVANLLDMIKLEAGAIRLHLEPTDVLDIIGAAGRRCQGRDTPNDAWLDMGAEKSCLVEADQVLLEQVIYNVLDNARQYSTSDTPIRVTLHAHLHVAEIVIVDDGPGIPERDLERVFDKFYRVSATGSATQGTGLGLSISRGLVEAMGGTVHAVSPAADGHGTAIHISLKRVLGS